MSGGLDTRPPQTDLPIGLRCAIDQVSVLTGALKGQITGSVVGDSRLVAELAKYAPIEDDCNRIVALLAKSNWVQSDQPLSGATEVIALTHGPLGRLARSGSGHHSTGTQLVSDRYWSDNGFDCICRYRFQGIAYYSWAMAERFLRRMQRPDLADRCRIGMLRTLRTSRWSKLCAYQVSHYRRKSS